MTVHLPLPDWVQPVALDHEDTATARLTELLVAAQERGRVGRGELESAASQVVEEAMAQGVWLLGLARPPGRPAALLSVIGIAAPPPMDRHVATDLASYLADRGGPGLSAVRKLNAGALGTAVLAHRTDQSGAQAQAVVAEADGGAWYLLTLAAQQADRGPELVEVLAEIVAGAAEYAETAGAVGTM